MTDARYGPQTEHVEALIARLRRLTPDEATKIAAARDAAGYAARYAARSAWYAARSAARYAARSADRDAWDAWDAWDAAGYAAGYAARDAAGAADRASGLDAARNVWDAAWDAAFTLATRHLIGQYGYTRTHYLALVGPVALVIGPVHPDDPA